MEIEQRKADQSDVRPLKECLRDIAARCAALPDQDTRTANEIIGFDAIGVPE